MKLLVDSNVILDLFDIKRPGVQESAKILDYCQLHMLQGYFAAFSMPTILYVLRKKFRSPAEQQSLVTSILNTLTPENLQPSDLKYPFKHHIADYEDGLQAAAAERIGASYIITHNLRNFKNSPVPAITPEDFIQNVVVSS